MKYFENFNLRDKYISEAILNNSCNEKDIQNFNESSPSSSTAVATHPGLVIPLITYIQEEIVSKDLVDVQPIKLSEGRIYGMDLKDAAGNVISGTSAVGTFNDAFSEIAEGVDIPDMLLELRETTVTAISRKAKLNFSAELGQDLEILDYSLEKEKIALVGTEIAAGIDFDIMEAIAGHADYHSAITFDWDYADTTDYMNQLYKLKVSIMAASGNIASATRKGLANFVIVPVILQKIITSIPGFVANEEPHFGSVSKIGKLDYLDVYVNTFDTTTYDMYVGKKPKGDLSGGIVYSPYKVFTSEKITDPNNFSIHQLIHTMYGITKVDGGNTLYNKVVVTPTGGFPY